MENFDDIINWENLFKQSETFKNNKPFKFAFTEEIFKRDFYERLFETFPKYDKNDETWFTSTSFTKHLFYRRWGTNKEDEEENAEEEDPKLSLEWNRFNRFLHSQEFVDNIKKFSKGVISVIEIDRNDNHKYFTNIKKGNKKFPFFD